MIDYDNPDFDILAAEYETMYALVGYFIAQYSLVELGITFLLSVATRSEDPEAFHVLTKGMDAKTKIQRLRQLCRLQKRPRIGPKLEERIMFIHDKVADIRNDIAHSALFKSQTDPQKIFFSGVGRFPLKEFGIEEKSQSPPQITFVALERYGDWLNAFQSDLVHLLKHRKTTEGYEIVRPRSWVPSVLQERIRLQDEDAKAHSHDGKHRD